LDDRLAVLEKLAGTVAAATGDSSDLGSFVWRPGGREFDDSFLSEPLCDFYIQKSRIPERESHLSYLFHHAQDHQVIDWVAGRSRTRQLARRKVLEEQAWRHLYEFEQAALDD